MRVKLTTTITTYIETNASVEEARKEIFARYNSFIEDDDLTADILYQQKSAASEDEIIGTEVSHTFGDADE